MSQPSEFQKRISGEWHGYPSTFDREGNHLGYNKVHRESVFDPATGATTYIMNTHFHDLPSVDFHRLATPDGFKFGVSDSDQDRVYLGPDFYGSGQPYGGLVNSHYYSPFWCCDLNTLNWVLDDGKLQVYSSLLYEGPTIKYVFNGLYRVAHDYHTNPVTRAEIDAFCESERANGPRPHVLPSKRSGVFEGAMHVYRADQTQVGDAHVRITYTPTGLVTAEQTVEIEAPVETGLSRRYTFHRAREVNRHTFHGPDVFGNGLAYGRALFISQHFAGLALRISGREFLLDAHYTLANVWMVHQSNRLAFIMFGVLHWTER
ncbi:MAG: hypothetical protein ACFLMY_18565 [Candidatus Brachytrichaceae bacterium NZ_4S206]|jgi:hypothetical protein